MRKEALHRPVMFCGPPAGRAALDRAYGFGEAEQRRFKADMEQDLQFYQDLLYNPHASEYNELIANVVVHTWKVWGSLTGRGSIFARHFLVKHSLGKKWWEVKYKGGRRVLARDTAFHQIKLLVPYPRSWFNDTLHARHWCFKLIRLHVCKNWLALVRVVVSTIFYFVYCSTNHAHSTTLRYPTPFGDTDGHEFTVPKRV